MVLSRGLVISLGVSALGCTLLFLYFRNKISAVERKVDVMMDIIQNHQEQQYNMQQNMEFNRVSQEQSHEEKGEEEMDKRGGWSTEENRPERNLIDVSDDDDDASDSEEVSDSDEEDEIIPKLSLDKTEDMTLEVSDVKKITVQETDKLKVDNTIELEEVADEDITDSLDEVDDDEYEEEVADEDIKEVTVEKLDDEFDYTKLKVSELKALAAAKKLEGYKSLKKGPLIELLKSSE